MNNHRGNRLEANYFCVGASALMLYASFHPVNLGAFAWFAWVPLLAIVSVRRSYWAIFGLAWVTSLLFHSIGLSWLAFCTPEGWLITSCLEALYTGVSLVVVEFLRRRLKLPYYLVFAIVMTGVELERARFKFFAFPWLLAGQSQHNFETLIQIADLGGVYLVSFLVFFGNGLILDLIRSQTAFLEQVTLQSGCQVPEGLSRKALNLGFGVFGLALCSALVYGTLRKSSVQGQLLENGPRILLIQTDVPSRNAPFEPLDALAISKQLLALTEQEFPKHGGRFDLIVWPEALWPHNLSEEGQRFNEWVAGQGPSADVRSYYRRIVSQTRRMLKIPRLAKADLLVGSIHREIEQGKTAEGESFTRAVAKHNSVSWLDRSARIVDRFDKLRPVPMSEYVPGKNSLLFHWFFRGLTALVPEGFVSFEPGEKPKIFEIKGHKIAPNICFDVSFSEVIRETTELGAEYHLNLSNYSWFRSSSGLDLALVQGKFRAIETRRAVVKCVNAGPSVSFDADGSISDSGADLLPHFTPAKLIAKGLGSNAASLVVDPRTMKGTTFYVLFGDLFAGLCLLSTLFLSLLACGRVWLRGTSRGKTVVSS